MMVENTEDTDLSQDNGGGETAENADQSGQQDQQDNGQQQDAQQDDTQQDTSQENYRGKLNATNRFLEKEGYEFKGGRWQKPDASQQGSSASQQEHKSAKPASLTRDEAIVIAKGHSVDELEQANKVAALENCTVVEALDKDLFKDWKTRRDAAAKQQAAQLGVGRGSRATSKKTFATKDLSDDDHKDLFNEKVGR